MEDNVVFLTRKVFNLNNFVQSFLKDKNAKLLIAEKSQTNIIIKIEFYFIFERTKLLRVNRALPSLHGGSLDIRLTFFLRINLIHLHIVSILYLLFLLKMRVSQIHQLFGIPMNTSRRL